jgi:putative tricarboxylic transport membrane protein
MVVKATRSQVVAARRWRRTSWTPALLTGAAFDDFVDREFASLRATMVKAGMI